MYFAVCNVKFMCFDLGQYIHAQRHEFATVYFVGCLLRSEIVRLAFMIFGRSLETVLYEKILW